MTVSAAMLLAVVLTGPPSECTACTGSAAVVDCAPTLSIVAPEVVLTKPFLLTVISYQVEVGLVCAEPGASVVNLGATWLGPVQPGVLAVLPKNARGSGTGPIKIVKVICIVSGGVAAGTYNGEVTAFSNTSGTSVTAPITLTINDAPAPGRTNLRN